MAKRTDIELAALGRDIERGFLLPLFFVPMLWILLIHVGTRVMWLLGIK